MRNIYFLPGRNGHLRGGLGESLISRGFEVDGRELQDDFKRASFCDQVSIVAGDLRSKYWRSHARIIANSYGAYLFLHAQAELSPFPGRVLLLSSIVGSSASSEDGVGFIPPRSKKIFELAESGVYPIPKQCEIHVGSEDWQSNPTNVLKFGEYTSTPVSLVPGVGHSLPKEYVSKVLDFWLLSGAYL